MTDTVTNTTGPAADITRLYELVYDLGDAVARLTAESGTIKARLDALTRGPKEPSNVLQLPVANGPRRGELQHPDATDSATPRTTGETGGE